MGVGAETLTAGFEVSQATGDWTDEPKLRPSPAGYELFRYLGGGGMGDVYLAHELATDRILAMKFLRATSSPTSAARFQNEVRALARIEHPNIVRCISVDLDRVDPFYTMEYARSGTLADRVKLHGPVPPEEAARLMVTVARAVQAAHDTQILHRDLKPSNIVLTDEATPKVSDFGLAKLLDEETGQTYTSQTLGTPAFMPPEQISRKYGEFSPASDVYGLGATLYFLITGRPPFEGESHEETFSKVLNEAPKRPRAIRAELPIALEGIALKCLEKNPANRYAAAEGLARDLEKYLVGLRTDALPLTPVRRIANWFKHHRKHVARSSFLVLLGIVVALGIGWVAKKPGGTPPPPPDAWESIESEWKADRPVVMLGEKGKPRWYRWLIGAPEMGSSTTGDGSLSFELSGFGMLELCQKPPTDRYRIHAQIRFAESKLTGNAVSGTCEAGIYFGRSSQVASSDVTVHPTFAVVFGDLPVPPKASPRGVQLRSAGILQRPDTSAFGPTVGFRSKIFVRALALPGPWRPVEIDVTPEGVVVRWPDDAGKMVEFANVSSGELRERYRDMQKALNLEFPNLILPDWSPSMPFGIWCYRSSIDLKNVIVTPLSTPRS